jgi:hypothetical protein
MDQCKLINRINDQLEAAKANLERQKEAFADNMKINPLHAMEWNGKGLMQAACKVVVLTQVKSVVANDPDSLGSFLFRMVTKYTRPSSSCPISNLKDSMEAEEWARLAERLDNLICINIRD